MVREIHIKTHIVHLMLRPVSTQLFTARRTCFIQITSLFLRRSYRASCMRACTHAREVSTHIQSYIRMKIDTYIRT